MKARSLNATDQELRQAIVDLVSLGLGSAVVEICGTLQLDGGWIETLTLDEMVNRQGVIKQGRQLNPYDGGASTGSYRRPG